VGEIDLPQQVVAKTTLTEHSAYENGQLTNHIPEQGKELLQTRLLSVSKISNCKTAELFVHRRLLYS
jgi:hypothetical protein